MLLQELQGYELQFKTSARLSRGRALATDSGKLIRELEAAGGSDGSSSLMRGAMDAWGISRYHEQVFLQAARLLLGRSLVRQIARVVPYVGQVMAGVKAVKKSVEAASLESSRRTIRKLRADDFADEEYHKACTCVARYLGHEAGLAACHAGMSAVEVAIRTAPGGSAFGAVGAAAELALTLGEVAYLVNMLVAANEHLSSDTVSDEVLDVAPIVGCIMLAYGGTRQQQFAHSKRDRAVEPVYVKSQVHHKVGRAMTGGRIWSDKNFPKTREYERYRVLMVQARRIAAKTVFRLDPELGEDDFVDFSASSSDGDDSSSGSSSSSSRSSSSSSSGSSRSRSGSYSGSSSG